MRILIVILISVTIFSCRTKSTTIDKEENTNSFQRLVSNLKTLEPGYTYDLLIQDAEGCYAPGNSDTLFYNPPFPILGQFNNGRIYAVIHFEPGDDMWPIIRTFDKEGNPIDNTTIAFGTCAAGDCEFDDCDEKFKIINQNTIEDIITLVTTPCDSLGNKDQRLTKKVTWKKTITVDEKGKLVTKEVKS